jgi:hypothetical protein
MFYLSSRALITRAIWTRYPFALAVFMDCPACTGFWFGLLCAMTIGWFRDLSFLGLPGGWIGTPIIVGVCMIVATPITAGLMQRALEAVGIAAWEPPPSIVSGESAQANSSDFDAVIGSTITKEETDV